MASTSGVSGSNPYADLGLALKQNDDKASQSGALGEGAFLKLLTTQLQNQDPLKPLDNSAFLGQLAQISTVSGIQSLQDSFDALGSSLGSYQSLQAAQLVGHQVLSASDSGWLDAEGTLDGATQLSAAGRVSISILDSSGQTVRKLDLGSQPAGLVRFSWDGVNSEGQRLAAGEYTLKASVSGDSGDTALKTYAAATVEGVQIDAGKVTLDLKGLNSVALGDILQIM